MTGKNALILMAKAPIPGQVKTRLCPPFTRAGAAALYDCLLEDVASEMGRLARVRRFLFFSPRGSGSFFRSPPYSGFERCLQRGGDLGERMAHAFRTVFERGAAGAVLVGADCPMLSAPLVRLAFRELSDAAGAVFGPSRDGGFYLIGLSSPAPSLFRGIEWGTENALRGISRRCRTEGLPYALLPERFDIDTPDDVAALGRWARSHAFPACPMTRRWLISRGGG